MVSTYGIDGLRIDSAQQVDSAFFAPFQAAAGGMHVLGEVFNGNPTYVCPYQTFMTGVLNYPQYVVPFNTDNVLLLTRKDTFGLPPPLNLRLVASVTL
jgi:hypothetical protein